MENEERHTFLENKIKELTERDKKSKLIIDILANIIVIAFLIVIIVHFLNFLHSE